MAKLFSSKKTIPALTFSGNETFSEVLHKFPEGAQILFMYGLGCVGCHHAHYETLIDGFVAHGFSKKEISHILKELHEAYIKIHPVK